MVLITLRIKLKKYQKTRNPRVKYNLKKLEDPNVRKEFQARLSGKFAPPLLLKDVDEMEGGFTREMNAIVEEVLGRKIDIKQPWVRKCNLCNVWCLRNANTKICRELRVAKEEWINAQC